MVEAAQALFEATVRNAALGLAGAGALILVQHFLIPLIARRRRR